MRNTSVQAYNHIKDNGALSKLRWTVYDFIYSNGPVTQRQAIEALDKGNYSGGTFTSRFSELKRLELITEAGTTECRMTGRIVTLWDVTDKLPKVLSNKEKLQIQIEQLEQKLNKLKTKLKSLEK